LYASFRDKLEPSMRQVHGAGEKAFVDYSGKKPHLVDGETGEVITVELFVMVLGQATTRTRRPRARSGLGTSSHPMSVRLPISVAHLKW
jgi:transposase